MTQNCISILLFSLCLLGPGRAPAKTWGALHVGSVVGDPFVHYDSIGLSGGLQINDRLAVRAGGSYLTEDRTNLGKFLEDAGVGLDRSGIMEYLSYFGYTDCAVNLTRPDGLVTPYLGLGLGLIQTKHIPPDNPSGEESLKVVFPFSFGLNWSLSQRLFLRTEVKQLMFDSVGYGSEQTFSATEISAALGFAFGE